MMTIEAINKYIDGKIKENEEFIRITYLEVVEEGIKQTEILAFSFNAAQQLSKKRYSVYRTNQKYFYKGDVRRVESNELLVAIKKKKF